MSATSASPQPYKLLLLSDDEFYREMIQHYLSSWNSLTVQVVTQATGLLAYGQDNPDIVLLDEQFEDHQVEELVSVIRLKFSEVQLLVYSAKEGTRNRTHLMRMGVNEVLEKDENLCELLGYAMDRTLSVLETKRQFDSLKKRIEKNFILASHPSILAKATSDKELTLEDYTMQIIEQYLARYDNNVVQVARKLGVGKSTIYRYLKDNKLKLTGIPMVKSEQEVEMTAAPTFRRAETYASAGSLTEWQNAVNDGTATPIDLNQLFKASHGNASNMVSMMDAFLRSSQKAMDHLQRALTSQDRVLFRQQLNRLKPLAESIGIEEWKQQLHELEMQADATSEWSILSNSLGRMTDLYRRAEMSMRQQRDHIRASGISF